MKAPLVSVVIPAHNRPELLLRAVDSVLAQTDERFELIVVDDGSREDLTPTAERVQEAGQAFVQQLHGGVARARNRGAALAQGEWLAFLDSDDFWHPEKLAVQLATHDSWAKDYQASQCAETWIRQGRQVAQGARYQHASGDIFAQCLQVCCVSCSSVMLRRVLFDAMGGFDERYPVCEDYALWIALARQHAVAWIPDALTVKHGGHADQLSKRRPAMDRFRVHALLALWHHPDTLPHQQEMIAREVFAKANTLHAGAMKRGLPAASLYQRCMDWSRQPEQDLARVLLRDLEALWQNDGSPCT